NCKSECPKSVTRSKRVLNLFKHFDKLGRVWRTYIHNLYADPSEHVANSSFQSFGIYVSRLDCHMNHGSFLNVRLLGGFLMAFKRSVRLLGHRSRMVVRLFSLMRARTTRTPSSNW